MMRLYLIFGDGLLRSWELFWLGEFRVSLSGEFWCFCLTRPLCLQAIRVFFMLRSLSLQLQGEPETQLPLTRTEDLIKTDDVLDLSKTG